MRRRSRLLRVAKWGGVVVCVLLAGAWLASLRWSGAYVVSNTSRTQVVGIGAGAIHYQFLRFRVLGLADGWRPERTTSAIWWPDYRAAPMPGFMLSIPLWMPLVTTVLLAASCVLLDRPLPGHCPCGYNLRGNESGTCPECGQSATYAV
ncbi:MAG: hypothetical protein O7F76_04005 [Planctomycetota bacterium]|nr:hypothetical protein [Planctomycetota bacterium]